MSELSKILEGYSIREIEEALQTIKYKEVAKLIKGTKGLKQVYMLNSGTFYRAYLEYAFEPETDALGNRPVDNFSEIQDLLGKDFVPLNKYDSDLADCEDVKKSGTPIL